MQRWSEKIQFTYPPREIRLGCPRLTAEQENRVLERERASYELGRADGERSLREQLVLQRTEMQGLQQGVLGSLQKAIPALMRDSEASLVQLTFEIARKMVGDLPITASMIETEIQEALNRVEQHCQIEVSLNPADFALLQSTDSPLLTRDLSENRIRITPSSDVSSGGCILRTDFGTIDSRREIKFAAIRTQLEAGI